MEKDITSPCRIRWRSLGLVLVVAAVLTPIGACERAVAPDAAQPDVGPDWAVVEKYLKQHRAWSKSNAERAIRSKPSDKSMRELLESLANPPDVGRAIAAATAILDLAGAHDKTIEAAEFLVMRAHFGRNSDQHMYVGAKALLAYAPGYQKWLQVLSHMDSRRMFVGPAIDTFFEELASEAEDAVLRANGNYYVAAGFMRAANRFSGPAGNREVMRQRAIEAATGLSASVEAEKFLGAYRDGTAIPQTLAEAEVDLLRSIRHGTVGATLPDVKGTRLDGIEECLSDYRGRIVLLDFWATWCGPCVVALPKLRELVAKLPPDRFAMVAISVDEELGTVTQFIEDEPLPWTNWHAGERSDFGRLLRIRGYPTYVLVDEHGKILARLNGLIPPFTSLIEKAVDQLGKFGSTHRLDVESIDFRSIRLD